MSLLAPQPLAPLPGDPDSLSAAATRYEGVAQSILEAARRLSELADNEAISSKAVDAIREQSSDAAASMHRVHPRYNGTATALSTYSVALRDAQDAATGAASSAQNGSDEVRVLEYHERHLEEELLLALADPDEVHRIQHDLAIVRHQLASARSDVSGAVSAYNAAVHDRDVAAQVAISAIKPVLDQLNDGLLDRIHAAVDALGDFVDQLRDWVGAVLKKLMSVLQLIVIALAVIAIVVIALVAIALVLAFPFLAPLILLGAVLAITTVLVGTIVASLVLLLAREAITPTPTMTKRPPVTNGSPAPGTHTTPENRYEQTMLADKALDDLGGEDSTNVQVIKVIGDDGVVRWRVILPSTQDWEWMNGMLDTPPRFDPHGDKGAMNDLGSNIALMATPQLKAAYERAVIEAMQKAGVGPNDPVMLCGWSQGGILAGKMASENPPPFNIQAVFAAGSPIDAMDIPSSVHVISVQHPADIVPKLDVTSAHPSNPNWVTISAPTTPGQPDHGATSYGMTAHDALDGPTTDPNLQAVKDAQAVFFSDNESSSIWVGHE